MPNPALVAGTLPGGEFDWGGRLPNSTEARKGPLSLIGNQAQSAMA